MKSNNTNVYQHYKGQKYLLLATALHSETLEEMVVYVSLYDNPKAQVWVRPAKMFFGKVLVNGKKVPRFKKVG